MLKLWGKIEDEKEKQERKEEKVKTVEMGKEKEKEEKIWMEKRKEEKEKEKEWVREEDVFIKGIQKNMNRKEKIMDILLYVISFNSNEYW